MTDPSLAPSVLASLSGAEEGGRVPPRWYSHAYNRAELYRLAAAMGWLPRPARLGLARVVGRAARRLFPAERAVVRATLEVMTATSGARLDELTAGVFRDFAMCFSDLVTTNRQPSTRLTAHVSRPAARSDSRGSRAG
jgi:lauroyl/myristoyl acyltransferase